MAKFASCGTCSVSSNDQVILGHHVLRGAHLVSNYPDPVVKLTLASRLHIPPHPKRTTILLGPQWLSGASLPLFSLWPPTRHDPAPLGPWSCLRGHKRAWAGRTLRTTLPGSALLCLLYLSLELLWSPCHTCIPWMSGTCFLRRFPPDCSTIRMLKFALQLLPEASGGS